MKKWISISILCGIVLLLPLLLAKHANIQDLLSDPSCVSTCWLGIETGISSEAEMLRILDEHGIVYQKNPLGSQGTTFIYSMISGYTHPLVISNSSAFAGIIIRNEVVSTVDILFNNLSVNDLVRAYGIPEAIIDYQGLSVDLAYSTEGLVFSVREDHPDAVFSVRVVNEETVNRAWINATFIAGDYFPCSDSSQLCELANAHPDKILH